LDISHKATTRFVSVYDERDPVEYRTVGPFEFRHTYCIDDGMIRMPGLLHPLESPQSDQHDRSSDTQELDSPCRTQSLQGDSTR